MQTNGKNVQSNMLSGLTLERKSGLVYSVATVMPTLVATIFLMILNGFQVDLENSTGEEWYRYANFLLPQIALGITVAFFILYAKTPANHVFGKTSPKYFLIAVIMQIGLLSLTELNGLFLDFLGQFGYQNKQAELPSMNGFGILGVILVVGMLPAVFEESVFRGVMLGGMRAFGQVGAILICGGLFALYHQNPAQTIYQFCCGSVYALLAFKAGSALPTMIAHFINNTLIIVMTKFGLNTFPLPVYIPIMIVSGLCLAGSLAYLLFFDKKETKQEVVIEKKKADFGGFFLLAAAGILICLVNWISKLISGF